MFYEYLTTTIENLSNYHLILGKTVSFSNISKEL